MPRARDVVRLLLVSSAPSALIVLSFSGGQHLQPAPSIDSRLRWQWRWCQGSRKRCRRSFSPGEETAASRRYHYCCSRLTLHFRHDQQDLNSDAIITTAVGDQKSSRRSRINGDTPAEAAAVAGASPGSTRYTIDMDVHPDVADVAVKHACQLSRFLEHHPISAHTEQAYALATNFVRDFHLSRQGSGNGQADLGQVQDRGEEGGREDGGHQEEGEAVHQLLQRPLPVVLDSGCGTGRSSILLAKSHTHLPVLGVDRSAVRLSKGHGGMSRDNEANRGPLPGGSGEGEDLEQEGHDQVDGVIDGVTNGVIDAVSGGGVERAMPSYRKAGGGSGGGDSGDGRKGRHRRGEKGRNPPPDNLLLLRADLVDLWILASRDNAWKVEEHSILYPNPYPKHSQLRSRWHGHPVFPILLGLGGRITLRSNWKPYLEEVCQAVLAISAEDKEGGAAGGGAGDGGGGGTLLRSHEKRVLAANDIGDGTGGPASRSSAAAAAAAAALPAEATAGTAGSAALSWLVGGRGENKATGRYVGRSYAIGQGARPRDQFSSKTTGQPAASSGTEVAAQLLNSSSISSTNRNISSGNTRASIGAADSMSEVPATIAAAAASYEVSARAGPSLYVPVVPATNFEAKYTAVGEAVYELRLEPRLTR